MGSSNESSAFGPCHNPYDLTRTPGGSSGGSAAALAAREVFGALGTDTGGSIRQPAAFTNTVGSSPPTGACRATVSSPMPRRWTSRAHGRTVGDVAALMQVVARHDPQDSTSRQVDVPDYRAALEQGVAGLRLGVPRELFTDGHGPGGGGGGAHGPARV
jgi:aspartyl-tRNA(Asn)/glutamyl-tRNA(Gln) amidotransferase subunit A